METSPGSLPSSTAAGKEHSRFSFSILESYLYGKNIVLAIDMENIKQQNKTESAGGERKNLEKSACSQACDVCLGRSEGQCATHGPLESLRQLVHAKDHGKVHDCIQATYAVLSFPDEVQLCTSSIPGANYGVCAKQHLPSGTWIGPYEGRRTSDQRLTSINEYHEHWWEIYEEGQFSHFIDGSDESLSSWMRFICSARDDKEQNMSAFQYGLNIYYRSFRDIHVGEELLVWYSDSYLKHLGIPFSLKDSEQAKTEEPTENLKENRLTSTLPASSVSNSYSTNPIASEPATASYRFPNQSPTSSEQAYGPTIGKSTVRYSFQSFEPVAPIIQQALANQIKERRERIQSIPKGPVPTHKEDEFPEYIPRESEYPPRKSVYPRRESECHPRESECPPRKSEYAPRESECAPRESEYAPRESEYAPRESEYAPRESEYAPRESEYPPRELPKLSVAEKEYQERYSETGNTETGIQDGFKMDLCSPFKCRQCSKVFTQRVQLQMHVCPKSPYKPFQCGHCSSSFAHPSELRNHVVVHTSERPFKCGFCGRSFAGATTLNNHVRTHTGEKPFVCSSCRKTFSIATQLSRHMRVPGECAGYATSEPAKQCDDVLRNEQG